MPDWLASVWQVIGEVPWGAWLALGLEWLVRLALIVRIVAKRCPGPESLTWVLLIGLLPLVGLVLYALLGERRLGTRRVRRHDELVAEINSRTVHAPGTPAQAWLAGNSLAQVMARVAQRVTDLAPMAGNSLELIDEAPELLERLAVDIDRAQHHVHMAFYICASGGRAQVVYEALERAAVRGVRVRMLADHVGSLAFFRSQWPARLRGAGVLLEAGLPVNPLRRRLARIDLRNHRKLVVIDGRTGYCGSQNLIADRVRTRLVPPRYRYWLDATARLQGPAVAALQAIFLADWMTSSDEQGLDCALFLREHGPGEERGASMVHVVPSGPSGRPDAIHQTIKTMLNAARRSVVMTTPYFVPDEALKASMINAALRGVRVQLIVPHQLDNALVAAASRAHFAELLDAGVEIWQHAPRRAGQRGGRFDPNGPGLLHAKAAVIDDEVAMIGSANLDMRSFWLNFECTLFIYDHDFASRVHALQDRYMAESARVDAQEWAHRPAGRRLLDHAAQLLGPLL